MYKKVNPINIANKSTEYFFTYSSPRICPVCETGVDVQVLASYSIEKANNMYFVFILFFCPHCEDCFIGTYTCHAPTYSYENVLHLQRLIPKGEDISEFSDNIQQLSPRFVEIYRQSEKAEQWGLSEICGMGYRKSLEFLVKDYAIFLSPTEEDAIKSKQLSPCINDYIDNKRIKSLAKASAWIGNDEAHYTRKHEEYNIENLKAFITAMISFIDSEFAFMSAEHFLGT